jgi:hypothetical protein
MKDLQKYGVISELKMSPLDFYNILCTYKEKENSPDFEAYACTYLDDINILTFVSPRRIAIVKRDHKRDIYFNTTIDMDEAFRILNPYLRKDKIEKINGRKN